MLDIKAAKKVVQKVADDLGVWLYDAVEGILRVSNKTMYGALRLVSIEQGYNPRDFSLVAFGGAGPLHANSSGKLLDAYPVIIPPSPDVLCAYGDVTTVLRHEVSKTFIRVLEHTEKAEIANAYQELLQQATKVMSED